MLMNYLNERLTHAIESILTKSNKYLNEIESINYKNYS